MELLFESRLEVQGVAGKMIFATIKPAREEEGRVDRNDRDHPGGRPRKTIR